MKVIKGFFVVWACFSILFLSATVSYSAPPVASFTADPASDTVGAPVAVQFTDISTGTPTSWLWDFDDGLTSTEQNPLHPFYASGTYSVSLTVDNGEGQDTIFADYIVPVCNILSPVMLDYDSSTYDTIMEGYDHASIDLGLTDFTLKILAGDLGAENVYLDANVTVALQGGYDCSFVDDYFLTSLPGSLTISSGTVIPSSLVLSASPPCVEVDVDGDTYSDWESTCGSADDCNDNDRTIHPGALEIYNDGIDQNCDGHDVISPVDEDCGNCHGDYIVNMRHITTPDDTCEACHSGRVDNFLSGHYGQTVRTAGNNMIAGMQISCTSCHDWHDEEYTGYAIDGDHIVWAKVEATWSDLTSTWEETCDTCHETRAEVHAIDSAHQHRLIDGLCGNCHTSDTTQLGQPGNGTLETGADVYALHRSSCLTCHVYQGTLIDPALVEQAIANGLAGADITCLTCHTLHHTGVESGVSYDAALDTSQPSQTGCAECHHDYDTENGTSLGLSTWEAILVEHDLDGVKDGSTNTCQNCHAYDGSGSLLLEAVQNAISGGVPVTCANCHTDKVPDVAHAHDLGQTGTDCQACHGHDAGYEYETGKLSQGRGSFQSHSTHTEQDADDLKGPELSCEACHDTNNFPNFITGTDANGDGHFSLAEADVCNNCHSPGGVMNGVDSTNGSVGAKDNWQTGIYDGTILAAGKARWCDGCHDDGPANSKADNSGVSARNVLGDSSTYGYYQTGHGKNASIDCLQCHSSLMPHVDNAYTTVRNVIQSAGNPTNYRFYIGKGLQLPYEENISEHFKLCYSCHDEAKLVAPLWDSEATTNFRQDTSVPAYLQNFHRNHVDYTNCIFCHDPHGTTAPRMTVNENIRNFKYISLNSEDGMYYELTDSSLWDSPVDNNGGAITSPMCSACHGGTGLPVAAQSQIFVETGWYTRLFNDLSANFLVVTDLDSDGISDSSDNCVAVANNEEPVSQTDSDGDNIGDACDNCPELFNPSGFPDADEDGIGDPCDACPFDPDNDLDGDGVCGDVDNCINYNPDQGDIDGDGYPDACDNCPDLANPDQKDVDIDGIGDVCDATCSSFLASWYDWSGTAGAEEWVDVTVDGEGNSYTIGTTNFSYAAQNPDPSGETSDIVVAKYDKYGNQLWAQQYARLGQDYAGAIKVDSSGVDTFVYLVSYGYPGPAGIIRKLSDDGTLVWERQFSETERAQLKDVAVDASGNIYVAAVTHDIIYASYYDFSIFKYDGAGNRIWKKQYGPTGGNIYASALAFGNDGMLYVGGQVSGSMDTSTEYGADDAFIMKLDPANGDKLLLYRLGTSEPDGINDLVVSGSHLYVTGATSGSFPGFTNADSGPYYWLNYDIFLAKLDYSSGVSEAWLKQLDSAAGEDRGQAIDVDSSGKIYVTGFGTNLFGQSNSGMVVLGYDTDGNEIRRQAVDDASASDQGNALTVDANGAIYIAGIANTAFDGTVGVGGNDFLLLKEVECSGLDSDGDGVDDAIDNCALTVNPGQDDSDVDGVGDVCDPCPGDTGNDPDQDGLCSLDDNCPDVFNDTQDNSDGDILGDACDNCDFIDNPGQDDLDYDLIGDVCDGCPNDPDNDSDGDGVCGDVDNCPETYNPGQDNYDSDNYGDACDPTPNGASPPTMSIAQPNGQVVQEGELATVIYTLSDVDDTVTADFFWDTDNAGGDGTALNGSCSSAGEGADMSCSWDTTGMTGGTYYIYARVSDGINPELVVYSGPLIITAGCPDGPALSNAPFANSGEAGIDGLTPETAYGICTLAQLNEVRNYMDKYFVLLGDIDASDTSSGQDTQPWNGAQGWLPIGDSSASGFTGVFDGNGFQVIDLFIDRPDNVGVGLFGFVQGPIKNVRLVNADVRGKGSVGSLVGRISYAAVDNAHATGTVTGNAPNSLYIGGLVGEVFFSDIYNSSAAVTVGESGGGYTGIGGLAGYCRKVKIEKSFATGDVYGLGLVGGLTGYIMQGTAISDSYATGNVTGTGKIGGLVGYAYYENTVTNAYATGNVTGGTKVGGLIGESSTSTTTVTATNSFAVGNVTAATTVDFSVGALDSVPLTGASNLYYSSEASVSNSGGGQITDQDTFASPDIAGNLKDTATHPVYGSWDFYITWQANPGGFPILR